MARRAPRRITASRLRNITLHYLERYTTSRGHLRRLLMNRAWKAAQHFGDGTSEAESLIDAELGALVAMGLLNDQVYANDRAVSLHDRGSSQRMIRSKLRAKGVSAECIDVALGRLGGQVCDADLHAACVFARKRRMGPWSRTPCAEISWEERNKYLGRFARAGFSFEIARRILAAQDPDELDR